MFTTDEIVNQFLALELPFHGAPQRFVIEKMVAEVQFGVEDLFPTFKSACEAVQATSDRLGEILSSVMKTANKYLDVPKIRTITFILNQMYLLKDNFSIPKFFSFLLSLFLFLGKNFAEFARVVKDVIAACSQEEEDDDHAIRLNTLGRMYSGEVQFDSGLIETALSAVSNHVSLVTGGITLLLTTVLGINLNLTGISNLMRKVKFAGDGLNAVNHWMQQIVDYIIDQYYQKVHGCTRKEMELRRVLPEFASYQKLVYTLLSIPSQKFLESKYLCEKVKETYALGQKISNSLASKDRMVARELSYVFSNTERKFMPLYDSVRQSPLYVNVTRDRPRTMYFYGQPGVGKSNLINMLAFKLARELYPNRTFNGENSIMWSRRVENEFHDGYAHQPIVQFDDFLQAVDSRTNPNPEIRELIYMVNDAPFQLHMSDIKEKKSVYFDSEHVFASSNIKIPQALSIHDVSALRRRFDFAFEVKVKPEYGSLHRTRNDQYYRVDSTKVQSNLDMNIYELHRYDLETGNAMMENGQPVIMNFDQMLASYVDFYRTKRAKAEDVKRRMYEELGLTITEDRFEHMFGDSQMEWLTLAQYFPQDEDPEPSAPPLSPTPSLDTLYSVPLNDDGLDPEIAAYLERNQDPFITQGDLDDEEDTASFEEPIRDSTYMESIRSKCAALYVGTTKCFDFAMKKIYSSYKEVVKVISQNSLIKYLGVLALIGSAILYMFYPSSKCKLSRAENDLFSHVCRRKCPTCDYVKSVCGSTIHFDDNPRVQLAHWNLKAARVLARDDAKFNKVADHWKRYLEDIEEGEGEVQYSSRKRVLRARKLYARPETYGRADTSSARAENYGRTPYSSANVESYGRTPAVIGEVQVGSSLDIDSVLGANEQYVNVIMRNSVVVETSRFRAKGLFVQGRVLLINRHYSESIQRGTTFTVHNPGVVEGTLVRVEECRFVDLVREGHNQDLTLISLPKCIPCRPDITNKLIEAPQQALINASGATLAGFRTIDSRQVFTEMHFPELMICDVASRNENGQDVYIRKAYGYVAATKPGDCGLLLFTHSKQAAGKLIGFHSSGNRKQGYGFAEALCRKTVLEGLAQFSISSKVSTELPDTPYTGLQQFADMGDTIHIGQAEHQVFAPNKTEIVPSKLQGVLAEAKCKPAHLKDFTLDGERISPFKKGLAKVMNVQKRLDPQVLKLAVQDTARTLLKQNGKPVHGILSYEQAITGINGDDMIGPVKRNTSPGYPWVALKKTKLGGKKEWLNVIIDGIATDEYRVDEPTLKRAVEDRIESARKGVRTPAIYTATLKDERRPKEKVDAGKTRVFTAAPQDYVIAVRQYFMDFVASVQDNRIINEVAVGIDHNTEWAQLYTWLQGYGDNNVAGDFSNFDGSLLSEVLWSILGIINTWYNDGEENALIREVLFEEIANSFVYCQGHIIQWTHSQPSGNPLTVILNSIFQMIMFRYAYLRLKEQNHLPLVCDFRRNVRMVTYGDDGVLSIKSTITPWFNQETITAELATAGLTYTDEAKSGKIYNVRPLSDISFLKRKFAFVDGIWQGQLDSDVIFEMCLWTKKNFSDLQTIDNCNFALMEASNHGGDFYTSFMELLAESCDEVGIDMDFYSYDEVCAMKYERYL